MKTKEIIKLILSGLLGSTVLIASMVIPCFFSDSIIAPVIGLIVGFVFIVLIVSYGLPVWFKDYIKEFWENEEKKKGTK